MTYREAQPAAALRPWIAAYWSIDADANAAATPRRIIPDGCADLICDFTQLPLHAYWVGTMTHAIEVHSTGQVQLFGIRFKPGGLYPFLGVPLCELTDNRIELAALPARHWRPPVEGWHDNPHFTACCAHADTSLMAALSHKADSNMRALLQHLHAAVELPDVAALSAESGIGMRTLQRRFMESLGVSPRQHLRYLRFERGRRWLESRSGNAAEIATAVGYSDQAHFVREFARFAGVTPGRWR